MPQRRPVDHAFATTHGVAVALGGLVDIALAEVDLTPVQYRTLGYCAWQPATPSEIAGWRAVKKQVVSRPLNVLVERGLLQREPDPADRRRIVHTITPRGSKLLAEAESLIATYLDAVLDTMPATKAKAVRKAFGDLGEAFDRLYFDT
jgi:DNA-binding MarR family transcriptional regulator